jgi:hypothetical protein
VKSLYVHIGHYKTGTTAFQSYCSDNAAGLARRGLLYPSAGRGPSAPTNHAGLSIPLAAEHGFHPPRWFGRAAGSQAAFDALHAEFDAAPQRKALLSSEEFLQLALCANPEAALGALRDHLAPYRVRVIFSIREPLALLRSWYAQVSRGAAPQATFLDFAAGLNPDFLAQDPIRARVSETFGPGKVKLIAYRGVGPWLKRRMLWSTGTIPYSRASLPVANVTGEPCAFERRRIEKGAGVTRTSLHALKEQLNRINLEYSRLAQHLQTPPSALTLPTMAEHYRKLIEPVARHVALDPREADAMRGLAQAAGDTETSGTFHRIAALIDASQACENTRGPAWA